MKFRWILASLAVCASALAAEVGLVEEIIAKVNGDIITRSEIERSRKQLQEELKQRGVLEARGLAVDILYRPLAAFLLRRREQPDAAAEGRQAVGPDGI